MSFTVAENKARRTRGIIERGIQFFFAGNAVVAVAMLALNTIFLCREGFGFSGENLRNLRVYRTAGLEYVGIIRAEAEEHSALTRSLNLIRRRLGRCAARLQGGLIKLPRAENRAALPDEHRINESPNDFATPRAFDGTKRALELSAGDLFRVETDMPNEKQAMIEIDDVSFADRARRVPREVGLHIPARAATAFIGPSAYRKMMTLPGGLNWMNKLVDGAHITRGAIRIEYGDNVF